MSKSEFDRGYTIACANIVSLHDETSIAADVMGELNISWSDVLKMDLSDYDMSSLRKIRKERSRKPFQDGRQSHIRRRKNDDEIDVLKARIKKLEEERNHLVEALDRLQQSWAENKPAENYKKRAEAAETTLAKVKDMAKKDHLYPILEVINSTILDENQR